MQNIFNYGEDTDVLEKEEIVTKKEELKTLLLINDDVSSFELVIWCLMKYLKMDAIRSEQIALLVHHKGKCDIKRGSLEDLLPYKRALQEHGLTTKIVD